MQVVVFCKHVERLKFSHLEGSITNFKKPGEFSDLPTVSSEITVVDGEDAATLARVFRFPSHLILSIT